MFTCEGSTGLESLRALPAATRVEHIGERVVVYGRSDRLVVDVVETLLAGQVRFRDLGPGQPSLEDAFLGNGPAHRCRQAGLWPAVRRHGLEVATLAAVSMGGTLVSARVLRWE